MDTWILVLGAIVVGYVIYRSMTGQQRRVADKTTALGLQPQLMRKVFMQLDPKWVKHYADLLDPLKMGPNLDKQADLIYFYHLFHGSPGSTGYLAGRLNAQGFRPDMSLENLKEMIFAFGMEQRTNSERLAEGIARVKAEESYQSAYWSGFDK